MSTPGRARQQGRSPEWDAVPCRPTEEGDGAAKERTRTSSRILPPIERRDLSREDLERVYIWIDANIFYYGTFLYTDGSVNGARDRWYASRPDGWFRRGFAPVFDRRCAGCHRRTVDISDAWLGRCAVRVTTRVWTDTTLMDQGLQIEPAVAPYGPEHRMGMPVDAS